MKHKKNIRLFKNHGMSLVEVIVVGGILGFLALAVSTTFSDIFKMQAKVTNRNDANEFGASLARFIYSESTCTQALKDQDFTEGGSRTVEFPNYVGFADAAAKADPLRVGDEIIPNKVRVSALTLTDKQMPVQNLIYNTVAVKRYLVELLVGTQTMVGKKGGVDTWVDVPPRRFEFPLLVRASDGKIEKCMIGSSLADACEAIGSELDTATGKCKPVKQCFFKGHYTTNTCTSGVCPPNILNPVTGDTTCPGASTPNRVGPYTWEYPDTCGKKCTTTVIVTTNVYLCLRCN